MPLKKLLLKLSDADEAKARGTEQATEIIELMVDNWEQIQEKFSGQTQSEKEEMMDHFNSAIENLGDVLFGEDSNIDDFEQFAGGFED